MCAGRCHQMAITDPCAPTVTRSSSARRAGITFAFVTAAVLEDGTGYRPNSYCAPGPGPAPLTVASLGRTL